MRDCVGGSAWDSFSASQAVEESTNFVSMGCSEPWAGTPELDNLVCILRHTSAVAPKIGSRPQDSRQAEAQEAAGSIAAALPKTVCFRLRTGGRRQN